MYEVRFLPQAEKYFPYLTLVGDAPLIHRIHAEHITVDAHHRAHAKQNEAPQRYCLHLRCIFILCPMSIDR